MRNKIFCFLKFLLIFHFFNRLSVFSFLRAVINIVYAQITIFLNYVHNCIFFSFIFSSFVLELSYHSRYTVVYLVMYCTSSFVTVCLRKLSSSQEDVFFMLCFNSLTYGFHARYICINISAICVKR